MSYKERCYNWVEARKMEDSDGLWWEVEPESDTKLEGPYKTEQEIDDVLWKMALDGTFD